MRIAIFSDTHSNPFALRAVLPELERWQPERVLFLGDAFGYYPWAQETFEMLRPLCVEAVLGNHDRLVLDTLHDRQPNSVTEYFEAAVQNARTLSGEAREWLAALPTQREFCVGAWRIRMVHGTPDDPLEGRLYPDNTQAFPWLPRAGEILVFGHTHYPILRQLESGGWLLNPGSVGQPRDGDPRPAWLAVELTEQCHPKLHRVSYDIVEPMAQLRAMRWPSRFIAALNKTASGPLVEATSA